MSVTENTRGVTAAIQAVKAVAAEREACARVCDDLVEKIDKQHDGLVLMEPATSRRSAALSLARQIRARGAA